MPWKIIILFGALPIAAYWLGRYVFYQKSLRVVGQQDCRLTAEDYARKLSFTGKIPRSLAGKRTASALAEISLATAYERLKVDHPQPVKIRLRADLWSQLILPFSIIIAVIAIVAMRPAVVCIATAVVANAVVAVMKFTSRGIAKHAADRAIHLMRGARIPSASDEPAIEASIRALTWK